MKKIYSLFTTAVCASFIFAQTTITQWNFNAGNATPSTGSGTATISEATGSSTFPAGNVTVGNSWQTSGFPAQGTSSGKAGFSFAVSTLNYENITVSAMIVGASQASKYCQMQYTVDNGATWVDVGAPSTVGITSPPGTWVTINRSIPAVADNNANFGVRVVTVFDPANSTTYSANGGGGAANYLPSGIMRIDNVTISGTAVNLGVSDIKSLQSGFIKNTLVKDDQISFDSEVKDVKIFSVNGQLVKAASKKTVSSVDVSDLVKGNYIVTGTVNNQPVSQKILKD